MKKWSAKKIVNMFLLGVTVVCLNAVYLMEFLR